MRREDLQVDWLSIDALVASRDPCCLRFNLCLHLRKVFKLAPRLVVKLSPFVLAGNTRGRMGDVDLIRCGLIIAFTWDIDQLKNEWSSGDNAASSGQEIPSNYVF